VGGGGGSWFAGGPILFQMRKSRRTNESRGGQHFSRGHAPMGPPTLRGCRSEGMMLILKGSWSSLLHTRVTMFN